ncbi:MAG: hypothetical protein U9Q90_11025 [Campylobacterota bacterium]|nr:hypothetical protein [Campylobacterota bacterium]
MQKAKPVLEQLMKDSAGEKLLFLGKEEIFTIEEIERFLKRFELAHTDTLEEGVVAVIEHMRLNPVEEDISNEAYDREIPLYKLAEFEKLCAQNLNNDELLMGIKLGNDQERLFRLLQSTEIAESLFLKLLEMYEWHEDEEDNTQDRDVIMSTLRRYIKIKPNEEDLLYSYLTLRRLATEATNPRLLQVLLGFPNYRFLVRGKEKVSLRETVARNPHIDNDVIAKLISFRDEKVDTAMVANPALSLELLQKLAKKERPQINEGLATNTNIDDELFEKLLSKENKTVQLLLLSQPIDMKRLALVDVLSLSDELFATIGANEQLNSDVVDVLIQSDEENLLKNLCANESFSLDAITQLFDKGKEETYSALARNPRTPVQKLETLYENYSDQMKILTALAYNKNTPEPILRALFERDIFEINEGLATNESVPMELLDILKVDTRLQNQLAQNEIFVKEYESVLDYDRKAIL